MVSKLMMILEIIKNFEVKTKEEIIEYLIKIKEEQGEDNGN